MSEYLIYVSELYKHEKKLSDYCLSWAYDCLLGLRKYDVYLEKTEPKNPFCYTVNSEPNLRLNVQREIGIDADPVDVLLMAYGRKTKFISNNVALYRGKVRDIFQSYSQDRGGWFNVFKAWGCYSNACRRRLFNGVVMKNYPEMEFPIYAYYSAYQKLDVIRGLAKEAENLARKELGVPEIGEGWISETELFRKLESKFSVTTVIQHGHPIWLGRQHFDIWFPHWKIAVEYHGRQHFEAVEFFGGQESFEQTVERDLRKIEVAKNNGVHLIVVTEGYDLDSLIQEIHSISLMRKISAPNA